MKILYFLIFIASTSLYALPLSDEDKNPGAEEILIKKPEKYLRDESMIYNFNSSLGLRDQRKYTGLDKNKFAV
ncbi:MAG TPA: hypothetical protein VKY27_05440, partial [Bacteriovoracaceae bacterium]|nr:hypothetical protein [Bacteriovoracaceae bacterium]